jgi:hypothetical protein
MYYQKQLSPHCKKLKRLSGDGNVPELSAHEFIIASFSIFFQLPGENKKLSNQYQISYNRADTE